MAADGEHTVGQLVDLMGKQFEDEMLEELREQVHDVVNILVGEYLIRIHDSPEPLPPYLAEEYVEGESETPGQRTLDDGPIES